MPGGQGAEAGWPNMRFNRPAAAVLVCALFAACGTPVERRSLATGQPERQAYELNGTDLPALQREAQRLCPAGVDIVRSANQGHAPPAELAADAALWRRWLAQASDTLLPPSGAAQMVVVCRGSAIAAMPALQAARP